MRLPEAVAILESQRKLNDLFTKEENAIMLLQSILPKLFHDEIICASITFTLHVLKSKAINNETSSSINAGRKKSTADLDSAIKDWLISDYTESRNKRVTMKGLALSVKFTKKLSNLFGESDSAEIYVFEADSAERMRISEALGDVQSWGWDAWTLHAASKGRPLQALGWHLLHEWGLVKALGLDRAVLRRWLAFVEQHYQLVPYHNSTHAADVLQATHYLLSRCDAGSFLPATTIFAVLIAAMIHDAGHDGLNNLFHQKALTDRALAFNDQSVQEQYHCASVLTRTARDATVNLLAALDPAQAREARRLVILITLATDMKHHGKHTHDFQVSVLKLIVFLSSRLEISCNLLCWPAKSISRAPWPGNRRRARAVPRRVGSRPGGPGPALRPHRPRRRRLQHVPPLRHGAALGRPAHEGVSPAGRPGAHPRPARLAPVRARRGAHVYVAGALRRRKARARGCQCAACAVRASCADVSVVHGRSFECARTALAQGPVV